MSFIPPLTALVSTVPSAATGTIGSFSRNTSSTAAPVDSRCFDFGSAYSATSFSSRRPRPHRRLQRQRNLPLHRRHRAIVIARQVQRKRLRLRRYRRLQRSRIALRRQPVMRLLPLIEQKERHQQDPSQQRIKQYALVPRNRPLIPGEISAPPRHPWDKPRTRAVALEPPMSLSDSQDQKSAPGLGAVVGMLTFAGGCAWFFQKISAPAVASATRC